MTNKTIINAQNLLKKAESELLKCAVKIDNQESYIKVQKKIIQRQLARIETLERKIKIEV